MQIKSIASSSAGNCYVIEHEGKQLIIEAGVPVKRIRQALNFDLSNVVGCLISHEHGDHAKYSKQLEKETSIPIYCNRATKDRYKLETGLVYTLVETWLASSHEYFLFLPVKLEHDVPCYGFVIVAGEEVAFYATDTKSVDFEINGLTHLLIEANHSKEALIDSKLDPGIVGRISENHLAIDDVVKFVEKHPDLKEVHLLHLSDGHSNEEDFLRQVVEKTKATVYVARK